MKGGRIRPDGKEVRWSVTFPEGERGGQGVRGKVPFWCHDGTERGVRVPEPEHEGEGGHACGALGVLGFTVLVRGEEEWEGVEGVYAGLFGEAVRKGDGEVVFEMGRVRGVEGLEGGPRVVLKVARGEEERRKVGERGFWFGDVVLGARASGEKEKGARERIDTDVDVGGIWIEYV